MAGGQGAPETRARLSRRTKGLSETGDPRQTRLEPGEVWEAAQTEGVVAFKPQAPMIRKQLQVGCSVLVSQGGVLVRWLCRFVRATGRRSLVALTSTTKHIGANHDDAGERHKMAVISADTAEVRCSKGHIFDYL